MLYLDHVVEHEKKRGEKNEKKNKIPNSLSFLPKIHLTAHPVHAVPFCVIS